MRFPVVLLWLFKEPLLRQLHLRSFSAQAPPHSLPRKQQTPPESRFSSSATARSFPHGRSFWIQPTWNESIQVSATVLGVGPAKEFNVTFSLLQLMLAVIVACVHVRAHASPAGSSVTCCKSSVLMTSIRHDKIAPRHRRCASNLVFSWCASTYQLDMFSFCPRFSWQSAQNIFALSQRSNAEDKQPSNVLIAAHPTNNWQPALT